ncbi:MAG TPA: DUF4127 family protein [Actinopolymorphaceae bacterium]
MPVRQTAANQVGAAGARIVADPAEADAVLVVHAPARRAERSTGSDTQGTEDADVEPVIAAVRQQSARSSDTSIGLADVRYPNGSHRPLIEALESGRLVDRLAAYGGWNTVGNTIGSVVAALVAGVAGRRLGGYDPEAERRLLLRRLLEDYGYQAVVRTEISGRAAFADHMSVPFADPAVAAAYLGECRPRLEAILRRFAGTDVALDDVRLPWNRTFEIDFGLRPGRR